MIPAILGAVNAYHVQAGAVPFEGHGEPHRRETIAISGRFLAIRGDTQKSSWVLVDATAFAVFAGLSEDVWARLVGGFLDHSLGGAARIESVPVGPESAFRSSEQVSDERLLLD